MDVPCCARMGRTMKERRAKIVKGKRRWHVVFMNFDPSETVREEMLFMNCRKKRSKNQLAFRKRSCYICIHRAKESMPVHIFEENVFLTNAFDAIPFPTLVVDDDVRILFWNSAALNLLSEKNVFQRRGGEVLHCIHSTETKEGCGHAPHCKTCIVRISVSEAIHGGKVYRKKTVMELKTDGNLTAIPLLVTTSPYLYQRQKLALLILENIQELMQLGSLLPICAKCKKIRTDNDQWEPVEKFIKTHIVDVHFTHGLCSDCMVDFYSEPAKKSK
jgi:PAS domain-containing protein